jgi:hypothetical protein
MANEREPDDPLPVDFVPEGSVATHRVSDGEDWASVAAQYNVNVKDLIYFNFQTNVPEEVNWYLRRNVGCDVSNDGGRNWAFSSTADPGLIYIPPSEVIEMEPEDVTVRDDSQPPTDNTSFADELPADIDAAAEPTTKTGDCSGWERDPQSFAKVLADHYLRTELGVQPALVKNIWCDPGPTGCIVAYEDGREVRVTLKYQPGYVIARGTRPLPLTQRCVYAYDCTDSGELVFTKRSCDLYPP